MTLSGEGRQVLGMPATGIQYINQSNRKGGGGGQLSGSPRKNKLRISPAERRVPSKLEGRF